MGCDSEALRRNRVWDDGVRSLFWDMGERSLFGMMGVRSLLGYRRAIAFWRYGRAIAVIGNMGGAIALLRAIIQLHPVNQVRI
ncbi:MAG: hypothetical protein PT120_08375 [Aphanizomenon gracile PMC649.10]|nr:hypothetical protein [Aphanizomenon gracile PMC638.10]MDM3854905.1 hypothetical protein [Aphanizomenon gracile PMC649.10]MDM3863188.1 hypothetical protein [Aphanizomenon gracile PMC644.10]